MTTYHLQVRTSEGVLVSDPLDNIGTPEQARELAGQVADVLEAGGLVQFDSGSSIHIIPADAIITVTVTATEAL